MIGLALPNQIFKVNELKNLLIELDSTIDDVNHEKSNINNNQKQSPFFNFFLEIIKNKYNLISEINKINNKTIKYINKGDFDSQKKNQKIYELIKNDSTTLSERDI